MGSFTAKDWEDVLGHLAQVIGDQAHRYTGLATARLVAAIPYLAGSEDPDRFAVSNLLTFHGATLARALFDHRETDNADVFRRLATFHVGSHADPKVVDYGLTLLALASLADHEADAASDRASGKPNPVNSGVWDASALRRELEAELAQTPSAAELFGSLGTDALQGNYWAT